MWTKPSLCPLLLPAVCCLESPVLAASLIYSYITVSFLLSSSHFPWTRCSAFVFAFFSPFPFSPPPFSCQFSAALAGCNVTSSSHHCQIISLSAQPSIRSIRPMLGAHLDVVFQRRRLCLCQCVLDFFFLPPLTTTPLSDSQRETSI